MKHPCGAAWLKLGAIPKCLCWTRTHCPHPGCSHITPLVPCPPGSHLCLARLKRAANPLGLTPRRVLPCSKVRPSNSPPQIRPCSSTSTGPAALQPLRHGATPTVAESTLGHRQWGVGSCTSSSGLWAPTYVGACGTWQLLDQGAPQGKAARSNLGISRSLVLQVLGTAGDG